MVLAAVPEQLGVGVEAEIFADQLQGDDLAIRPERVRAALAEGVEMGGVEFLSYPTEDGEDKIVEGPGGTPRLKPAVTTGL